MNHTKITKRPVCEKEKTVALGSRTIIACWSHAPISFPPFPRLTDAVRPCPPVLERAEFSPGDWAAGESKRRSRRTGGHDLSASHPDQHNKTSLHRKSTRQGERSVVEYKNIISFAKREYFSNKKTMCYKRIPPPLPSSPLLIHYVVYNCLFFSFRAVVSRSPHAS